MVPFIPARAPPRPHLRVGLVRPAAMPALQVCVRELSRSHKRRRERALHVPLPAAGGAVAALLAAVGAPSRSRVAFSVRNAQLLAGDDVLGRLAHCRELGRLKKAPKGADAGSESDSEEGYVPEVGLKVAAAANEAGRRVAKRMGPRARPNRARWRLAA